MILWFVITKNMIIFWAPYYHILPVYNLDMTLNLSLYMEVIISILKKIPFDRPNSLLAANASIIAGLLVLLSVTSLTSLEYNPISLRPPATWTSYDSAIELLDKHPIPKSDNDTELIQGLISLKELKRNYEECAQLNAFGQNLGREISRLYERAMLTQ